MIKFGSYLISKIDFKIFSYSEIEDLIRNSGGCLRVYGGFNLYRTKDKNGLGLGFERRPNISYGDLITSSLEWLSKETKSTNRGYSIVYFISKSQAEKMQKLMSFDKNELEKFESCPNFILVKP